MKNRLKTILFVAFVILLFTVIGIYSYLKICINLDYAGILYTFANKTVGTSKDVIISAVKHIIPFEIIGMAIILFVLYFFYINKKTMLIVYKNKIINIKDITRKIVLISICIVLPMVLVFSINDYFMITNYYKKQKSPSLIYDDYYVEPNDSIIKKNEDSNNLILIYLESIETSFLSKDKGGVLDYNLLPNMYKLGNDNINFSCSSGLGGFNSVFGATWTVGALFASTSGIPFSFPLNGNVNSYNKDYSNRVICLGNILHQYGYYQEFLCGSNSNFGGRSYFYNNHGYDKIFDYDTAFEKGYVNDSVWWGLDDNTLYNIAKDELLDLSKRDEPFNLTMLTVDTHHVGGYVCEKCEDEYDIQYANVIKCADKQLYEFINWIKEQDFYEDTTIVIVGDHPTMDATLINSDLDKTNEIQNRSDFSVTDLKNRFVYNCFINSLATTTNEKNREFNTLDLFPTILNSIGFSIEGDRLGLGTNLFSNKKTLQEELGYEYLNDELSKYSKYYEDNFYNNK